jgi:N-acetylglucosaminyldiphosphoundecaprenol N-acetyl-beta-D-mannosaminyltransferase
MRSRRDERLRNIPNQAGMVTPDGMPLVWLAHLFGKCRIERAWTRLVA